MAEECENAMQRRPHKSSHLEREFVSEEMLDFCRHGYWMVLPYDCVRHWKGLQIPPWMSFPSETAGHASLWTTATPVSMRTRWHWHPKKQCNSAGICTG